MNTLPSFPNISKIKICARAVLYGFALTCYVFSSGLISIAKVQSPTEQRNGEATVQTTQRRNGVVRGRVVYEDTRRPLRRVGVQLFEPTSKTRRRHWISWTNGRGEFQFKNLPAGKYFVTVDAPGIIRSNAYGSEEAQKDLTTVIVDGTTQVDLVIRARRGGAISGKVTYADGDPVLNASIALIKKKDGKWVRVYVGGPSTDRVLTDERGVYRISGLSPGDYLVRAAEQKIGIELTAQDDPDGSNLLNRSLLPPTYYDGAINLSGAKELRVEAGDELTDIDITLIERPVYSISGVVILRDNNQPVARARITLKRKGEELAGSDLEEPSLTLTKKDDLPLMKCTKAFIRSPSRRLIQPGNGIGRIRKLHKLTWI